MSSYAPFDAALRHYNSLSRKCRRLIRDLHELHVELLDRDGPIAIEWYRAEDILLFKAEVKLLRREPYDRDSLVLIYARRRQWESFLARRRHSRRADISRAFASWFAASAASRSIAICAAYHGFKRRRRNRAAANTQPDIGD